MTRQSITFLKYISIIQRNTNRYFDLSLEPDQIGSGQQFFLLRIHENKGITMNDLAQMGSFDKGTVTKAVQKLIEQGYVRMTVDKQDKRVRHLYTTEQAKQVVEHIYELHDTWNDQITASLTPDERQTVFALLERMAQGSCAVLNSLSESKGEENENEPNE